MTIAPLPMRRMLLRSALVLVAVAAVAAAGLGVRWIVAANAEQRTAEALDAARTGTAEVLSYDAATLETDLSQARRLVTGEFAGRFEQIVADLTLPATREQSVTTTAEVVRAAVISARSDRVEVLLYVNRTTSSAAQPEPGSSTNPVTVTVTRVHGRWLISQLQLI